MVDVLPDKLIGASDAAAELQSHLFGNPVDPSSPEAPASVNDGIDIEALKPSAARDWLLGALRVGTLLPLARPRGGSDLLPVPRACWDDPTADQSILGVLDQQSAPEECRPFDGQPWFLEEPEFHDWLRRQPREGPPTFTDAKAREAVAAPFWNLRQTITWILFRDPHWVARCADDVASHGLRLGCSVVPGHKPRPVLTQFRRPDRPLFLAYACDATTKGVPLPGISLERSEGELLRVLQEGRLVASGFRNGVGDMETVGAEQWTNLQFLSHSRDGATPDAGPTPRLRPGASEWHGLRFRSLDVLALWQPTVNQDPAIAGVPNTPAKPMRGRSRSTVRQKAESAFVRRHPDRATWSRLKVEAMREETSKAIGAEVKESMMREIMGRKRR